MRYNMTNDPIIRYELALEAINDECARIEAARSEEAQKAEPSPAMLKYLDDQIAALIQLENTLEPKDVDAILLKFVFRPQTTATVAHA